MTTDLSSVKELAQDFAAKNKESIAQLTNEADRLGDACDEVDRAWSGSFIGHHGSYYYGDLTPPPANSRWSIEWGTVHGVPNGWSAWDGNDIKAEVEKRANLDIQSFSKNTEQLAEAATKLKTDIEIELSDFEFVDGMEKEKELFSQFEKTDFDIHQARADYINSRIPKTRMSRDSEAMMQGTYIPSHVTGKAGAYAADRIIESVKSFLELVDRFIRQLEKKQALSPKVRLSHPDPLAKLDKLLSRFHLVAQQMRERHANRPTIVIGDEYDVQDLLHSVLKIEFDDVRAEEWTPSYAGSATRMDFVLKKEEIVVEVKKTSAALRDKQVGEQLILDIAHYKAYTGCKTLVCFIYDPDFLLKNREGLIYDLQKTHDGLNVKLAIHPQ